MSNEYSHKSYGTFEERGRKKDRKKNDHNAFNVSPRRRCKHGRKKFNTNSATNKGFSSWMIPKLSSRIEDKFYINNKIIQYYYYGGFPRINGRII
jgi:hypothetical protein